VDTPIDTQIHTHRYRARHDYSRDSFFLLRLRFSTPLIASLDSAFRGVWNADVEVSFYFYAYFIPRSRDRLVTQSDTRTHTRAHDELAMRDVSMCTCLVGYRDVEVCKNFSRSPLLYLLSLSLCLLCSLHRLFCIFRKCRFPGTLNLS